jgi:hypothetical protein
MNKFGKWLTLLAIVAMAAVSGIWYGNAAHAAEAGQLAGRDFVRLGKMATVSGVLQEKDGEWYLKADRTVYAMHLGNADYLARTGIQLKASKKATVKGFVYKTDLSVCTINMDNKQFQFRQDDGTPLWAGNGNGRNRGSHVNW